MTTVSPATATPQTTAPTPARAGMLASDFEAFLRMLTVQIRNQDPLNPMQSTEFATQLATFAGVEQQVRMNAQLGTLSEQLGVSALSDLAGWIGAEVRVAAPVHLDGAPVMLHPDRPDGAVRMELQVLDDRGREVARQPLPTGSGPVEWGGTDAFGAPLPGGRYSLQTEAFDADGQSLGVRPVEHFARVIEARAGSGPQGAVIVLQSGGTVPAALVKAIR